MNIDELRRLEQVDLIKMIDNGELLPLEHITPTNPLVVDAMSSNGYVVITQKLANQLTNESAELAKLKMSEK